MVKFSIPFKHLTSKNDKLVVWSGVPRLSKEYREGKEEIGNQAKEQIGNHIPWNEPVRMNMIIYMPDGYRRDIHNFVQQICDGLEDVVYTDDWWICDLRVERGTIDAENPRADIEVEQLPRED